MFYRYEGPQVIIGKLKAYGIQNFIITEFRWAETPFAVGTITTIDHIENCDYTHHWNALLIKNQWVVRCTDQPANSTAVEKVDSPSFTGASDINEGLRNFISQQISKATAC